MNRQNFTNIMKTMHMSKDRMRRGENERKWRERERERERLRSIQTVVTQLEPLIQQPVRKGNFRNATPFLVHQFLY